MVKFRSVLPRLALPDSAIAAPLWGQILEVNNVKMLVNYGIEKLRFNRPVLAGDAVRLRASLVSLANLRGIAKAEIKVSLEIKDSPKTALDATVVFLYHFQ